MRNTSGLSQPCCVSGGKPEGRGGKEMTVKKMVRNIEPDDPMLQYSGRIDDDDPKAPVLIYAASWVKMIFTGTSVAVTLANHHAYWTNEMGYLLDGVQGRIRLLNDGKKKTYEIAEQLPDARHELMLFKRMDACHTVTFYGFTVDDGADLLPPEPKPARRMEVFGDSVSCGEVSEAVDYVGKEDPVHDGQYSNSWYSYAWMTARKLGAELHDTSQCGIALLDGTGWFGAPAYYGVESCYDKLEYNPDLGEVKKWDFSRYTPQVVVVAIGQNDNHPVDYMAADPEGSAAEHWRKRYREFIEILMKHYPKAQIILATTILKHHPNWDAAIETVCGQIASERVHHFLYRRNGSGTPGHIRIPEAEEMSEELAFYIRSLGDEIWDV